MSFNNCLFSMNQLLLIINLILGDRRIDDVKIGD